MSLNYTITHEDLFPGEPSTKPVSYIDRPTAKAVLVNDEGKIAVISHKHQIIFCQLPGGGVEEGETIEEALHRECFEETGYEIEIIQKIGQGTEVRDDIAKKYRTHIFLAKTKRRLGEPKGDGVHDAHGFEVWWKKPEEVLEMFNELKKKLIKTVFQMDIIGVFLMNPIF